MKKRFLPISLLLTIIILAQTGFVVSAKGDSGKYSPRKATQVTAQSFMKSIRANQETGLIDPAWLIASEKDTQTRNEELNWTTLGPDNYGSLTRGIIYDNQDATNKTIYIGTMGGGVFKSINGGITWGIVTDNLMVSCLAQTEDGTIYIGTGDGRGAHSHNGLSDLNYENSFNGTGIHTLSGNVLTQIETSSVFVNDMAVYGNKVYAATNEGLKAYENGSWTTLLEGEAYGVDVCSDGGIVAVIGYDVYMTNENGELVSVTTGEENMLPADESYKLIAVAPSDHNYIYVAYLKNSNETGNIYFTNDHGKTWKTAYVASSMYDIFVERGLLDNAMEVYPNNPRKVLIGGKDLWVVRDESGEGIYRLECISSGSGFQIPQSGGAFYYNYNYIHSGIQSIAFNPDNVNEFFVGSEGGIFKGTCSADEGYLFEGANRYMINGENHTSVTRMFNVAFAGTDNTTIGGCLDHGTIHIVGDASVNAEYQAGNAIYPNDISTTNAAETYGAFDYSKAGGPCAISTINPQIMFVTATGSNSPGTPLLRTQTAGYDYDKDNFTYSVTNEKAYITNSDAFRTPIVLFENYNDTKAVELVKYINETENNIPAGDTIVVKSNNGDYPFDYILTDELAAGDSIEVQDIISATMLVAVKNSLYMTRDALVFDQVARWWKIATISGTPNALSISKDGDVAYVGTIDGKLYKASGLTDAIDETSALGVEGQDAIPGVDGTDSIPEVPAVPSVITFEEIDGTIFNSQAITSLSINPNDANDIVVTLGNYGNSDYVFRSTDGGSSFTSIQGNLSATPVYSSLMAIDQNGNLATIFVGTENGIYSLNGTEWANAGITGVPVMDIKQQLQENHYNKYEYLVDEVGEITEIEYPGVFNQGMIYIATYGRGLFRCDKYHTPLQEPNDENDEPEKNPQSSNINVYPNPIINEATVNFQVEDNSDVTVQIYDLSGRLVMDRMLGTYNEGSHKATFNVEDLTSGTYVIKVQVGNITNTTRVSVY